MANDLRRGRTAPRAAGCAGSALVAAGGLGAGALPLSRPAQHERLGLVAVYTGLAHVWLRLGLLAAVPAVRAASPAPAVQEGQFGFFRSSFLSCSDLSISPSLRV